MLKDKRINLISVFIIILTVGAAVAFCLAADRGLIVSDNTMGYEDKLFDTSQVHTLDIVMDDWEGFCQTAAAEQYSPCTVVIDGEKHSNVGIRAKGNTSLTAVEQYGNDRYSFKVEFDQYDDGKSYHGLDKLSLNNLISDNTYMKDYICYTMMRDMGVSSPLCSFVNITVNGEDWGLYLAVEGVEESFLQRNYGADYGELYKPDSLDIGGGGGMKPDQDPAAGGKDAGGAAKPDDKPDFKPSGTKAAADEIPEPPTGGNATANANANGGRPPIPDDNDNGVAGSGNDSGPPALPDEDGKGIGGMGSADVKLQYIDDDPESYGNIFDNAKTKVSDNDKARLIESLKKLSAGEDLADVLDMGLVMKYFVVHDFVCNDDSYTGSMIHNYYLYEEDGRLAMIPWDYNLAFGGFGSQGGAASVVNSPIDSPVSDGSMDDRPMVAWIFGDDEYTEQYHEYYADFMEQYFESGYFTKLVDETAQLIAPYVENDKTAFCNYDEFLTGVETLKKFCELRAESVQGQLVGNIPSTGEAQKSDPEALVAAGDINLRDLGEQTMGGGAPDRGMAKPVAAEQGSQPDEQEDNVPNEMSGAPTSPSEPPDGFGGEQQVGSGGHRQQIALAVGSAAVLLAGIAFAILYRRKW